MPTTTTTTPLTDGGYVELRFTSDTAGGDGNLNAQTYDSAGKPVGDPAIATQITSQYQAVPLSDGGYVLGTTIRSTSGLVLQGYVFDDAGNRLAGIGGGVDWRIVASPDGGFMVASENSTGRTGFVSDSTIKLYDDHGKLITSAPVFAGGSTPSVSVDGDGHFQVAWYDGTNNHSLVIDPANPPDLSAPAAPATLQEVDDTGPSQGLVQPGGVTDDNTPTFRVPVSETGWVGLYYGNSAAYPKTFYEVTADDVARGYKDVAVSTAAVADGQIDVRVRVEDAHGVASDIASYSFTIDTTPPHTKVATSDGGYVDYWRQPSGTADPDTLHVQKHAGDGSLVGPEYLHAAGADPTVVTLSNGGYVVGIGEAAPGGTILRGEVFAADGGHLTEIIAGKDYSLVASAAGGFAVSSTYTTNHNFTHPDGLIAVYANDGSLLSGTGHVYSTSGSPTVSAGADGVFHFAWAEGSRSHDLAVDPRNPPDLASPPPPAIAYVDDNGDTLLVTPGGWTNDNTPTIRVPVSEAGYVAVGAFGDPGQPRFEITADDLARGYKDVALGSAPMSDGMATFEARVEDADGMVSGVATMQIVIDTQAPGQPTISQIADDQGATQGAVASGGATDDPTPTLRIDLPSGSQPNEVITVSDNGASAGTYFLTSSDITRGYVTMTLNAGAGQHSLTAQTRDQAGNVGTASAAFTFTEQSDAPASSSGQTINSPGPGSTLTGAAGDDTIYASQGPDVITTGGGSDVVAFRALPWNAGHVTDFQVGTDHLDLSAIFQASGYTGTDPVADGRMTFQDDGAGGTRIYFDHDQPNGGDWPFLITTLDHVAASGLTWAQLTAAPPPPRNAVGFTTTQVTHAEGDSGVTHFQFTVTRTGDASQQMSLHWTGYAGGQNGQASADDFAEGYVPVGSLTFMPGETSKVIDIGVVGDTRPELDEGFSLRIDDAPVAITSAWAYGTITNDDTGDTAGTPGQVYTAGWPGATVVGGAGDDTINASQGDDRLTGGAGNDDFVFRDLPWSHGHITDFVVGADKLDFSAIFQAAGYTGTDPVADGRMTFQQDNRGNTTVYFDHDQTNGGDWPFQIVTLDGVPAQGLTWAVLSTGGGASGGGSTGGGSGGSTEGQVITSGGYGSTLVGGNGDDTLNAGQGPDVMSGNGGADHFVFNNLPWRPGAITDFTPGVDKLDLRPLFQAAGYSGTDPIGDHRLEFRDDGHGNTAVYFDRDDPNGGDWPFFITTLQGVTPGQIGAGDWLFR